MRRSAVLFFLAILALLLTALTACGGGRKSTAGVPAKITVSPTSASIDTGQVFSFSVAFSDSSGNAVSSTSTTTFSSSNTAVATVSAAGSLCGGTWDANNIVCTPGSTGTVNITVSNGSLSATVPIYVHAHIDRLVITPASVNCKSQGQTAQMTAQALHNGSDITSTVGPITWSSTQTSVATVDSNGLVTAVAPGQSTINATVGSINGTPATFVTCPVQSIHLHVANAPDTAFTLASGATQQLAADVLDSAGTPVSVTLAWATSQPVVASVSSTGLVTAAQPGTAGITATCNGTGCNIGLGPLVYSNVVTATTTGTSANVVFAAGTGTTSLIPIDTTTNVAGTAITLPAQPNSLLVNSQGTSAFLGSSAGLMTVTTSSSTVANDTSHPGTVLAVSPDGNWVVVAGASTVFLVNPVTSANTQTLGIAGATAAAFTPNSGTLFITAGNVLWSVTPRGSSTPLTQSTTLTAVAVLASGAFVYSGTAANNVLALATCNNVTVDTVTTPGTPAFLATLPGGSAILAVDSLGIDVITPTTTLAGCPPPLSDTITSTAFASAITARQLIVLPDSSQAYVTSNVGLLGYKIAGGTATAIPLTGVAASTGTFTGGATLDSKSVYVGGDNAVHRIDVATGTDAQQITVGFTPDLVAVRPK